MMPNALALLDFWVFASRNDPMSKPATSFTNKPDSSPQDDYQHG